MKRSFSITAGGHRLWAECIEPAPSPVERPTLVFLHEGLGSIGQWRDFPLLLAQAVGMPALVYDRWGYGKSEGLSGIMGASSYSTRSAKGMDQGMRRMITWLGAGVVLSCIVLGIILLLVAIIADLLNRVRLDRDQALYELKKMKYQQSDAPISSSRGE